MINLTMPCHNSKSDVANGQIDEYDTDTVTDVDLSEDSKVHVRPACRTRSGRAARAYLTIDFGPMCNYDNTSVVLIT